MDYAYKQGAQMVDLKFSDMLGSWQHLTIPLHTLKTDVFEEGVGFDGSSCRGWRAINESDMVLMPDPKSAVMDPFAKLPTVSFICDVVMPETLTPYDRDPRQIAKKALAYLNSTGLADTAFFGPEAEFFIFDDVRYSQNQFGGFYQIDSNAGAWNSGRDEGGHNLAYKPRHKEGYFAAMPTDNLHDIRDEICVELDKMGMSVERHHYEVACSQCEINYRFDSLVNSADKLQWFKYIVKNVARRHNKTATFMPKPIFGDNGSGQHVHMSLWKGGKNLFAGNQYAGLSEMALFFVGGILKHAPSLCALTNPLTNSYKRLVPGFEAPIKLAYSFKNRSAAVRIPNTGDSPSAKRIEFRTPDCGSNPYLAFAALLLDGIDGIQNRIHPGDPLDKDIYGLPPQELAKVPSIPGTLDQALGNLKDNHDFLLKGEVFSKDFIQNWVTYKMEKEILPIQQRPTPFEFHLYYDL
ncbi:MAG: type I glutamate--ammonia ligase [Bdellovibrionaceae bacterium]|nr:type I glutamate--ammonia ligase [Pseudobdellovibrionaceae bacterium]